MRLTFVPLFSE